MRYVHVATFIFQYLVEFSKKLVVLGKACLVNGSSHLARQGITMAMEKHKGK
jgi:hypothetical protein